MDVPEAGITIVASQLTGLGGRRQRVNLDQPWFRYTAVVDWWKAGEEGTRKDMLRAVNNSMSILDVRLRHSGTRTPRGPGCRSVGGLNTHHIHCHPPTRPLMVNCLLIFGSSRTIRISRHPRWPLRCQVDIWPSFGICPLRQCLGQSIDLNSKPRTVRHPDIWIVDGAVQAEINRK